MQTAGFVNTNNIKILSYTRRHLPVTGSRGLPLSIPLETLQYDITGFGVRVHPTGRKVYIVKTRYRGRVIKMTIGPHGAVTPSYARVRAAEIITDARAGKNPAGRNADAPTMIALGKRFLKEYVSTHCKTSTAEEYRRSVKLFIDPRIGRYRVPDIQRSDIAALHYDMRDTPYQANRTLGVLSKMFNLAELWDLRPDGSNPCRHVKRFREEKRERFLSDIEYQRLGAALKDIEVDGTETASAIAAVRLLMLTGCRLSEIQKLRWEHVDLGASELRLPDTKMGAKVLYLGDPAITVLERIDRRNGNPWVIAGRKPGSHLTDLQHPWRRIRARAGLDDVRIHDLRHSCASLPYTLAAKTSITVCNIMSFRHLSHWPDSADFSSVYKRSADWTQWRG